MSKNTSILCRFSLITVCLAILLSLGTLAYTGKITIMSGFIYVILTFISYTTMWDMLYECK